MYTCTNCTGAEMATMANQKKIPHVHDPARTTTTQAAARADRRKRYSSMTASAIVLAMPDNELEHNARKGGVMAIAEQERRANEAMHSPADMIMPDPELDIGV